MAHRRRVNSTEPPQSMGHPSWPADFPSIDSSSSQTPVALNPLDAAAAKAKPFGGRRRKGHVVGAKQKEETDTHTSTTSNGFRPLQIFAAAAAVFAAAAFNRHNNNINNSNNNNSNNNNSNKKE
jgi:hypothetical protein